MKLYECTDSCPYSEFCKVISKDAVRKCTRRPRLDWLLEGYDRGHLTALQLGRMLGNQWDVGKLLKETGRN